MAFDKTFLYKGSQQQYVVPKKFGIKWNVLQDQWEYSSSKLFTKSFSSGVCSRGFGNNVTLVVVIYIFHHFNQYIFTGSNKNNNYRWFTSSVFTRFASGGVTSSSCRGDTVHIILSKLPLIIL